MLSKFLKLLIPVLIISSPVSANTQKKTSFTYAGLYKSLKTSKQSDFSQLSLHFLLIENKTNERCPTKKVTLSDGELNQQVLLNDQGALLLPLNKNLKTDHAAISFFTDEKISCHLSMEISVADFELDKFSKSNMISWFNQFEDIYSTLAGWPGRYFMPSVNGIAIHTSQKDINVVVDNQNVNQLATVDNILLLTRDMISNLPNDSELIFNQKIKKVLPTLEK